MQTRKQTKNHPESPRKITPRFMGFDQIYMVVPLEGQTERPGPSPNTMSRGWSLPQSENGGDHGQMKIGLSEKGQIVKV
jgi:hypothetical protein